MQFSSRALLSEVTEMCRLVTFFFKKTAVCSENQMRETYSEGDVS